MHLRLKLLSLFFCFYGVLCLADDSILEGRFTGVLRHEDIKRDQLAKLDFILTRQKADGLFQLNALLTVFLGGYNSSEYLTYVFDDVELNIITRTLSFKKNSEAFTVLTHQFSDDEFIGSLQSTAGNVTSKLILRRDGNVRLIYPLIEPVWGEFTGHCKSLYTNLQLYSFRSLSEVAHQGNLFAPYEIRGSLGRNAELCPAGRNPFGKPCIKNEITSGSYNFFRNRLSLAGNLGAIDCETKPGQLVCNGCVLKRKSAEMRSPLATYPKARVVFPEAEVPDGPFDAIENISGRYKGFVHHELTDQVQRSSMFVNTRQSGVGGAGGGLKLAMESRLHFGDCDNPVETLVFSFEEQDFGDPLLGPQFLFKRPGVDAIIKVSSIKGGIIRGIWYSRIFGRVGTFVLQKDSMGLPELPRNVRIMESISGEYKSRWLGVDMRLHLSVRQGAAPPTHNPFAPLTFMGTLENPYALEDAQFAVGTSTVVGGTYDFFTGRMSILTSDSVGIPTFIIGQMYPGEEKLMAKWVINKTDIPQAEHKLREFKKLERGQR